MTNPIFDLAGKNKTKQNKNTLSIDKRTRLLIIKDE